MNGKQQLVRQSLDNACGPLGMPEFQRPRIIGLREELEELIARLKELEIQQRVDLSRGSSRPRVEELREALREDHLIPISREGIRLLKGIPGIKEDLRVPHKRANNEDLFKAADRIFATAERYESVFRKARFKKSFVADGRRAVKRLEAGIAEFAAAPQLRSSPATPEIAELLSAGRELVRSIDGVVQSELRGAVGLKVWNSAKRIPKKVGRPKRKKGPPGDETRPLE